MATCYLDYGDYQESFKSRAELTFYDACKSALSPQYHVFHSVAWGLENLPEQERREVLYVGISRAKSMLYLCGAKPTCDAVLSGR